MKYWVNCDLGIIMDADTHICFYHCQYVGVSFTTVTLKYNSNIL